MSGRGRGRGAYYKAKYGGGRGRGRGGGPYPGSEEPPSYPSPASQTPKDWNRLEQDLKSLDGQQYGAYKRLLGQYTHTSTHQTPFKLHIDHVQGDAYAAPSRIRVSIPWANTHFPSTYLETDARRIALCDYVTRIVADIIRSEHLHENLSGGGGGWSGVKGGAFNINAPGQAVLPRTSCLIDEDGCLELRFTVALPAAGRTIMGKQAHQILAVNLVELVARTVLQAKLGRELLEAHVAAVEDQRWLRGQLAGRGLVAFVANGSTLPRASGASSVPLEDAIPFESPKDLEVSFQLPSGREVIGLGVTRGVTVVTGGGYHGKSTLLEALEMGVYDHIPGDGREWVVTDPSAMKIRAEDGRSVKGLDISPFISNLPGGRQTTSFTTDDASGSTSMAANIQEALEVNSSTLLIDEDSSATNLLVRDQRMQALIQHEPITPLIAKVRALATEHKVSTIIVIGGLGDWLSVADLVLGMDSYHVQNLTERAHAIAKQHPSSVPEDPSYGNIPLRQFALDLKRFRSPYAMSKRFISLKTVEKTSGVDDPGEEASGIDLSGLDQMVEVGQARLIAFVLQQMERESKGQPSPIRHLLPSMDSILGATACLPASLQGGDLVGVRLMEVMAALSRLRHGLQVA